VGGQLLILGVLFVIAYVLGRLGKLIGLPSIPIYMLVGLLASPHMHLIPGGFTAANVDLVAIFGLIFLLFNLGLEFDQDEFFSNARGLLLSGGSRLIINFGLGIAFGFWVGWGGREALIIAGMTATSSSAIVTKLLIELRRLANPETPVILGIAVVEDVFIAFYLAIVAVVIGGKTDIWSIVLELAISFAFLVGMFALARWGGKVVSRVLGARDDELFTVLFFGLAVAFGGIGQLLGVSDAIGAFLIGLVLGATRFRTCARSVELRGGAGASRRRSAHDHCGERGWRLADRVAQPAARTLRARHRPDPAEPRGVCADPGNPRNGGGARSAADSVRRTVRAGDVDHRPGPDGELRANHVSAVPRSAQDARTRSRFQCAGGHRPDGGRDRGPAVIQRRQRRPGRRRRGTSRPGRAGGPRR
jgi:hypothetical protein